MTTRLHRGDLPDLSRYGREVAIDTETMGLDPRRDRLCVVQLSPGDGSADVVQIPADLREAPNLVSLLTDPNRTKIFHYARFDIAVLKHRFGVVTGPIWCTKIASRLCLSPDTVKNHVGSAMRKLAGPFTVWMVSSVLG